MQARMQHAHVFTTGEGPDTTPHRYLLLGGGDGDGSLSAAATASGAGCQLSTRRYVPVLKS